jgi:glycosyltransferase involved in cell wall biosynthesis
VTAPSVTAVVPTRNAGRALAGCLASLQGFAETIVVDAGSEDDTRRIAEAFSATLIASPERSPARQRNEGIARAATEWVLCVDADERVSASLEAEIAERTADPGPHDGFYVPRVTWYLGRRIRHSGWQRDRVLRLFRRGRGVWRDVALHEGVALCGSAGTLRGALEHRSYETLDDVLEKLERYTAWGAREIVRSGRRAGPWEILTHPPARFVKTYLLKSGFRDGTHGAVLAAFSAYGVMLRYARAWEMRLEGASSPDGERA